MLSQAGYQHPLHRPPLLLLADSGGQPFALPDYAGSSAPRTKSPLSICVPSAASNNMWGINDKLRLSDSWERQGVTRESSNSQEGVLPASLSRFPGVSKGRHPIFIEGINSCLA